MSILNAAEYNIWTSGKSLTLGNRFYRFIWNTTWLLLAAWTPPQLQLWRRFLLRLFGACVAQMAWVA